MQAAICYIEGCGKIANYNLRSETVGKCCKIHKEKKMTNINSLVNCRIVGCNKRAAFNNPGESKAAYCKPHMLQGMVNVVSPSCKTDGCKKQPSYNMPGEKRAFYCKEHATPAMIDVKSIKCVEPGCMNLPHFNYEGLSRKYCSEHKKEGMIGVKRRKCALCSTQPTFNYAGSKVPTHCAEHKLEGMEDLVTKKCIEPGCKSCASCNTPGADTYLYCNKHKKPGMMNIKTQRCKTPLCDTFATVKRYEGYCLRCFAYSFPDRPISRNYKTKERAVADYIKSEFPSVSITCDKIVEGGCSSKRPDVLIDLGDQVIIVEIDENQHINYDCTCENKRLCQLHLDVGSRPMVFIRFNPDQYKHASGKTMRSPWVTTALGLASIRPTSKEEWDTRLECLKTQVAYWLEHRTSKSIEVVQLFYDQV